MARTNSRSYAMIIIGGGIIGAAFCYAASRRNIGPILMIDKSDSAPASDSATARSWAWVNAATDNDHDYFTLRSASMQIWEDWIAREEGLTKTASGGFLWDLPTPDLRDYIETHAKWGYQVRAMAQDEIAAQLPFLRDVPELAAYSAAEFAIEPVASAQALIKASGAEVINGTVDGLLCDGAMVKGVRCGDEVFTADEVILAAGNGAKDLLASHQVILPMASTTGLLVTTQPLPAFSSHLITAPDYHVRQMANGALLVGGRFNQDSGPKGTDGDDALQAARDILARLESAYALPDALQIVHYTLGRRVIPEGGLPVIGRFTKSDGTVMQGLYGAIMHSGISNAAAVAQYAINDILTASISDILRPYQHKRGALG